MAFKEAVSNVIRSIADTLHQPSREAAIAQPFPHVDLRPVNEPGSQRPIQRRAWYRIIDASGTDRGMVYICGCGHSNPYYFGRYNLLRELENAHYCGARCASVVAMNAEKGPEQIRHTITDDKGNVIPVGAPHSLRELLPDQGRKMAEGERDKVYATLPTWRQASARQQRAPFASTWNDNAGEVVWEGSKPNVPSGW